MPGPSIGAIAPSTSKYSSDTVIDCTSRCSPLTTTLVALRSERRGALDGRHAIANRRERDIRRGRHRRRPGLAPGGTMPIVKSRSGSTTCAAGLSTARSIRPEHGEVHAHGDGEREDGGDTGTGVAARERVAESTSARSRSSMAPDSCTAAARERAATRPISSNCHRGVALLRSG